MRSKWREESFTQPKDQKIKVICLSEMLVKIKANIKSSTPTSYNVEWSVELRLQQGFKRIGVTHEIALFCQECGSCQTMDHDPVLTELKHPSSFECVYGLVVGIFCSYIHGMDAVINYVIVGLT